MIETGRYQHSKMQRPAYKAHSNVNVKNHLSQPHPLSLPPPPSSIPTHTHTFLKKYVRTHILLTTVSAKVLLHGEHGLGKINEQYQHLKIYNCFHFLCGYSVQTLLIFLKSLPNFQDIQKMDILVKRKLHPKRDSSKKEDHCPCSCMS